MPNFILWLRIELSIEQWLAITALGVVIVFVGVFAPVVHTINYVVSVYSSQTGSNHKHSLFQDSFWQSTDHPQIIWGCSPEVKRKWMTAINKNFVIGFKSVN